MTPAPEIAAYCLGKLGPGQIENNLWNIQHSGLTVAILGFLHIGRPDIAGQNYGDLIYNSYPDDLLFSNGVFNPGKRPQIDAWPKQVAQLKQNSSVKKIFFSIGGQGYDNIFDFRTIESMLNNGLGGVLKQNFFMLRQLFLTDAGDYAIDGIDLDCEESVDPDTIVAFSKMLFEIGFEVTFCPYENRSWWYDCMQQLWSQGHKVSWWNLQCFDGGVGNRANVELQLWLQRIEDVVKHDPASYLMLGLAASGVGQANGQCPTTGSNSIEATFANWRDMNLKLRGGFLWNYDAIDDNPNSCGNPPVALPDYVQAVSRGLTSTV
jgi:hypothetical protein